ncbi:MAG: hypothetical protein QOF13_1420 [Solirubrobacterales bacterium]|nr:hypothetical protein [Solirubrobacterales bacterium]
MTKFSFIGAVTLLAVALCTGGCGGSDGPTRPARYDITINNGWPQIEDEKQVAGFLESAWRDPVGPIIAINTRLSDEIGSPMANAQLAQIQTSKLPGYRERGLKRIKLGGRPVVRWAFDMPKEESRFELFFEECGTSFIVRGSMGTVGFEAFVDSFSEMASTIKVNCDE